MAKARAVSWIRRRSSVMYPMAFPRSHCRGIVANSPRVRRSRSAAESWLARTCGSSSTAASVPCFTAARQQDWPTRPITVVDGVPARFRDVDVVARILQHAARQGPRAAHSSSTTRPGAGGNVASETVAHGQARRLHLPPRERPATHGVNAGALPPAPVRGREADFTPISTLVDVSNVLAINPAGDRRHGGEGLHRPGEGGARQVQLRLDRQRRGHAPRLRRVRRTRPASTWCTSPTRARPDAIQAVLNGDDVLHLRPGADRRCRRRQGRQGEAARRHDQESASPAIPDVPTIDEAGRAGLRELHLVRRSSGPRASTRAIAQKMNLAIKAALADPEDAEEARRARQHAPLRDPRPVPGDRHSAIAPSGPRS
jgi:tripartite-type tricarboxylate transporter receptor subunit TctC